MGVHVLIVRRRAGVCTDVDTIGTAEGDMHLHTRRVTFPLVVWTTFYVCAMRSIAVLAMLTCQ